MLTKRDFILRKSYFCEKYISLYAYLPNGVFEVIVSKLIYAKQNSIIVIRQNLRFGFLWQLMVAVTLRTPLR